MSSLFVNTDLARRLERAEGLVGTSFCDARVKLDPACGATSREIGGMVAMFDGPDSPITQTFALGTSGPLGADDLDAVEAFFGERGAATLHEVCPHASVEAHALLAARGYRPVELSNVLLRNLSSDALRARSPVSEVRVRVAAEADRDAWVDAAVAGWAEGAEVAEMMRGFTRVAFANARMTSVVGEIDGVIVATASFAVVDGVALLAGASTIPSARGRGAQQALLTARLAMARERGAEIAMMATAVGSTSQHNAQRSGFDIAYTRTKWRLG